MEGSSTENEEKHTAEKREGQENNKDESFRQEIEDIVRGFIIEKDILAQSHEEEINRMKQRFDLERKQLLKQLEMEKEQMIEASRIGESEKEVSFALSNAFVSEAGRMQSFAHSSGEGNQFASGFHRQSNGVLDIDDVDSNLIREIAEVYLRINNGTLTSQMRPELDLEDKYEREREALERSFHLEKRELKRKLEEDCYRRLEQDRIKYEGNIADLKTTISELQWQKREAENLLRHEKEKWEMNTERDKNETEKRHLQIVQETRRKLEEKHSSELEKQRNRYEENISDLQTDISKLTMQLKELNENLNQEKEIIVTKFEREVKEMEQAFLEQRNSLKANFEAEFMMRIENETSLLKSLNIKLKEDLENMEKEKKEVEKRGKEDKRKLEERFEEEISEMEQRHSEEKRALKLKLEERYQQGLVREKGALEETVHELSEEIALLKQENAQMEITFAERRDELQRRLDIEREEMKREAANNREEIRMHVEKELSQKFMLEQETRDDAFRYRERDVLVIQAKYDDLEMQLNALCQEREMLLRDKVNLEENLKTKEKRLTELNSEGISGGNQDGSSKMKELIREKDNELAGVKFENQQLELSLSAMKREKVDMEDEIVNLKRRLSNSPQQFGNFGENVSSDLKSLQEKSRRKDEQELSSLQRDKHELEIRLSSVQRKNDELEDELASLRRKKLEVEDEISALKRDKAESDNQVTSLIRDKAELEELIKNLKRKQSKLEDTMSAMKREKVELEYEVSVLKRHNSTMEIEVHRLFNDQQENSHPIYHKHEHEHVSRNNTYGIIDARAGEIKSHSKDNSVFDDREDSTDNGRKVSEMNKVISDLTRQQHELESSIRRLSEEKADLEKDLHMQLEYRRNVSHQETESVEGREENEANWVPQRQKDGLERRIVSLKKEQAELESKVSQHHKEVKSLEEKLDNLKDERATLESDVRTLRHERQNFSKMIENAEKGHTAETRKGKRQMQLSSPRGKDENSAVASNEQQFTTLSHERDAIRAELTTLKKQFAMLKTEVSTKSIHRDTIDIDEYDISELKGIRVEFEREIAVLRRRKTELEAAIGEVQEDTRREEYELKNMRKQRMELELQITALKSQNTRLEAEGSVLKDERKKSECEVDGLRREKANLEKEIFSLQIRALQFESTGTGSERDSTKYKKQQDEKDIERQTKKQDVISLQSETDRLVTEKNNLEKKMLSLQSEQRSLEDKARDLKEQQSRDHYEVDRLRREKFNLEEDVVNLQSDKRREETEISLLRENRYKEESDVKRLTQEKTDLERDILSLQVGKERLESGTQIGEHVWKESSHDLTGLRAALQDFTENVESFKKQKEELQSEITRIEAIKKHDEEELRALRQEKTEMEIVLSRLRVECNIEGREEDSQEHSQFNIPHSQAQLGKIKEGLLEEITKIQTAKNQEENELQKLRQRKLEMEAYIYQLQGERGRFEMERERSELGPREKMRDGKYLTDDDTKSGSVVLHNGVKREEGDTLHNSHLVSANTYNLSSYSSEATLINNSYSYNPHLAFIQTDETNGFGGSMSSKDSVKEDNDVISMKRERSELESQVNDLRIQLTQLQTEVTSLENRKTMLETRHGSYVSESTKTGQMNGRGVGVDSDVDLEITKTITEDRRDLLIQEYEEQIRELRQKKVELEQKVSVLEWQLENMKQKLELQEISHRREISSLNEKNQSMNGYHGTERKDDTLREFYQKLSYFLMSGEHSNKEIMEEIERQISNLQQKADFDYENTKESLNSPSVKLEKDKITSESEARLARDYASHLKAQMETADNQLKTCEKIIHRLYGENNDLTKENLNLEGKLKTASRSQDKLQRKKILLQKLVDKLSHHIGKDLQHQSFLLLELDKDVSL